MSADEGSPTEGLTEEQRRLRDIEDQVIQQERMEDAIESADPGGAESAASSVSSRRSAGSERQAASMQDSAPGDWEEAFAESPSSLDRSQGIGPTDIETTDLPSPAGYSSSAHSAEGDADLTDAPWRHSTGIEVHQERQTQLTYAPGGSEGAGGGGGGPSPDRSRPERSAITLREDEDRIEQAPQSTPRPGSEDRSPNRSRKRPREGSSADMPSAKSAKCVVRRLGALMPTSQPRPILMSTPKHEDPLEAAAQALRQLLHAWKRLLGLTPCSRLPDVPERMSVKPSVAQRFCPALWMLVFLLIALGGVGLQWARCQRAYLARLTPEHAKPDNATMQEYVCQHSFVWTYLLPRLIFLMGYISVFVCWFCLKHPDFITVIADTYDTVTDQHEYPGVSERFVMYCRFDRRVLTFLFVFVAVLSAVGTLVGDGVIAGTAAGTAAAAARDTKHAGIVLASDVFNFVIKLVHDNVMFLVLASHTLSLKYFDLMLQKTQLHFGNIINQAHISSDAFVRKQYMRGYRLMAQSQAAVSAVMLMVLLRVCQAIVLIILDQTQKVPRTESLGLLPLVVTYTVMVFVNIYRCCGLTKDGRLHHARHLSTGPDFAKGGAQDPEEGGDEGGDNAARLEPRAGAAGGGGTPNEWSPALDPCPAITGRVFGVDAGPWLFVVVILVMAGYCGGYYAVERYWPLF